MPTNFDIAKPVSDRVELVSVSLSHAEIDAKFDPIDEPSDLVLGTRHRAAPSPPTEDDPYFRVHIEFEFRAEPNSDSKEVDFSSDNYFVRLFAQFLLIYSVEDSAELTQGQYLSFADLNGTFNAWPYWRELIQTSTGRVGLAGITIPTYRARKYEVSSADNEMASPRKASKKKSGKTKSSKKDLSKNEAKRRA